MIEQDFIMLIINCKKYIKKAKFQKLTWLKTIPSFIKYYHVIGDESLETDYKFDDENNILWVKVQDDYNSLPKKVILAYEAIQKTFEFQYIFKTDDDQNLNNLLFLNTIKELLLNKVPQIHYGGHIVNVDKPYLSQYHKIHPELPTYLPVLQTKYCSGRFYLLSFLAVQQLITKRKLIEDEYLEDYAIGFNLDTSLKTNILNIQTNKYFNDII
jgi:hypothetical protein